MKTEHSKHLLADRLGMTHHVSPLRIKLRRLMMDYPTGASNVDDWLIDIANLKGANIVSRSHADLARCSPPPADVLSTEEIMVGLCLLSNEDRLQSLRLAAQLISRGDYDIGQLLHLIRLERVEPVIGSLAAGALHADPHHHHWLSLQQACGTKAAREPLLHWTRLAEPIPDHRHVASGKWRLVA